MVQEEFEEKKKMIDEFVNSKGYRSMSIKEMAMVLQVPSREKKIFAKCWMPLPWKERSALI